MHSSPTIMKHHTDLNGLRAAAAAFLFVQGASAGKIYCADVQEKVVAEANCDGQATPGTYYMFNSQEEHAIGSKVDLKNAQVYDSADAFEKRHELFPADIPLQEFESDGFGKRACRVGGVGGGYRGGVFVPYYGGRVISGGVGG
ncbi:uncharacterized protein CLUP02_02821 [Colletotrichum lupini]|uniref:Uncharacterized protein n=1 Tax=Colletotrichum lupini TaxID=145971 RepID=A0A9Q8SHQ7_9PEZI|nr:uncharacterized protein CLUP02_02821 [Colletotrichum lupini]UQC77353.1 hypothetical protein CLUP02_02821 [Colletotrichum lupini]